MNKPFNVSKERRSAVEKISFVRMTSGGKHAWFFDKKLGKEVRKQFAKVAK